MITGLMRIHLGCRCDVEVKRGHYLVNVELLALKYGQLTPLIAVLVTHRTPSCSTKKNRGFKVLIFYNGDMPYIQISNMLREAFFPNQIRNSAFIKTCAWN
jgi:hypothetical protein